jgi:S1-C subfamily serine protease
VSRPGRALIAALACAALVAGCSDSGGGKSYRVPAGAPSSETVRVRVPEGLDRGPFDPHRIYEALAPGVVTVIAQDSGGLFDGPRGQGSGFVLDGRGYIATNAHVIRSDPPGLDRADEVYVELADGNRVQAEVVGDDLFSDVALLRIDPRGLTLTPLELGTTKGLEVGAPVVAIGSPFGEVQSLSVGVISALDRSIDSLTNFKIGDAVQTDAAINHGNSGGPLLDRHGRVIGINAQIQSTGGGGEGVGFAVPVDTVRRSIAQLRETHHVKYAYLGVSSIDLYPQLAQALGFAAPRGALVAKVDGGGPADDAGIEAGGDEIEFQGQRGIPKGGDAIVGIDGRPVESSSDVGDIVAAHRPGERVRVDLVRGSQRRTVTVTLGERKPKPAGN